MEKKERVIKGEQRLLSFIDVFNEFFKGQNKSLLKVHNQFSVFDCYLIDTKNKHLRPALVEIKTRDFPHTDHKDTVIDWLKYERLLSLSSDKLNVFLFIVFKHCTYAFDITKIHPKKGSIVVNNEGRKDLALIDLMERSVVFPIGLDYPDFASVLPDALKVH